MRDGVDGVDPGLYFRRAPIGAVVEGIGPMADLVFLLLSAAVFAVLALVVKGVEKL